MPKQADDADHDDDDATAASPACSVLFLSLCFIIINYIKNMGENSVCECVCVFKRVYVSVYLNRSVLC